MWYQRNPHSPVWPEFLKKIDLSESAINVLLAGEVGFVVVDQVLLLSCPEIIWPVLFSISVWIIGCAKTIILILFVAIFSDWRPPWGKLMGTLPRLLHKVLHHVKRHAGGLPDQILLNRHFSPLHQLLIAISSNFVLLWLPGVRDACMPRGPLKHILLRVELRKEAKIGFERIICVRIEWSRQKYITAQRRQISEL